VTDRANVDVRIVAFECFLSHGIFTPEFLISAIFARLPPSSNSLSWLNSFFSRSRSLLAPAAGKG